MSKSEGQEGKQTTVEEGTEFKGTLSSTCPVVVRGTLDGDIKAPALTVAESGVVVGKVEAETIRSEGTLAGNVDADDVFLSGNVRSDTVIRAKTLEVKLRRDKAKLEVTFGECILEVGDEPAAEAKDDAQTRAQTQAGGTALAPRALSAGEPTEKDDMAETEAEAAGRKKKGDKSAENGKSERLSVPPSA